jgi:hypothetical protein
VRALGVVACVPLHGNFLGRVSSSRNSILEE